MEWKEQPQRASKLLQELDALNKSDRWEQHPHLTELIYCLTKAYYNRFQPLPANSKETTYFVLGLGLQQSLAGHRKSYAGEYEGIYYEIDFVETDGSVGELKTTRMALTKHPDDWSDGWRKQLLGYLKVQAAYQAIYYVLYVIPPELKSWEVEATQEEIDTNWKWLLERKAVYDQSVTDEKPPTAFAYAESWECSSCRYLLLCQAAQAKEKYG